MAETNHKRKKLVETQSNARESTQIPAFLLTGYYVFIEHLLRVGACEMIARKVNLHESAKAATESQDGLTPTAKFCFLISGGNSNIKMLVHPSILRFLFALQMLCVSSASVLFSHTCKGCIYTCFSTSSSFKDTCHFLLHEGTWRLMPYNSITSLKILTLSGWGLQAPGTSWATE